MCSALIVDDEPHARAALTSLVAEVDWLECAGEAASGPEAVRAIDSLDPELVFLDIRMPGWSGMSVLGKTRRAPVVVFTTAFSEHAAAAFEIGAADYLLKPFSRERFLEAIGRARRLLETHSRERKERLHEVVLDGVPARRVFVKHRDRMVAIEPDAILRLEADGDYVQVHTSGTYHLVFTRLGALCERLDPARFLRVHRSHAVNLTAVRCLRPAGGGRFEIEMSDGSSVVSSRRRAGRLRHLVL